MQPAATIASKATAANFIRVIGPSLSGRFDSVSYQTTITRDLVPVIQDDKAPRGSLYGRVQRSVEEVSSEVGSLDVAHLVEQGAWVVEQSEVSPVQVVPVLLAG